MKNDQMPSIINISAESSANRADVSVLIPTFNRAQYLADAIRSVLGQTRAPREIIVIDDGSTDGTEKVCAAFGDAVRYVRQPENAGKTAAINRGLSISAGEFIWVMDDDDIAPSTAISDLIAPLEKNADIGFSFGRLQKFRQTPSGKIVYEDPQAYRTDDHRPLFVRLMEDCFITGQPCTLIRKRCLDAIAPFDESVKVSVDYAILLELAQRADGVDVGTVVLFQRQHEGLRGPESLRYREHDRIRNWMESDARLLTRVLSKLGPAELCGLPPGAALTAVQTRRANFQMATIAARKNLLALAAEALSSAAHTAPEAPLEEADRLVLREMLGSRYGIDAFIESVDFQRRIINAVSGTRWGAAARFEISKRLTYWILSAVRQRDLRRLYLTGLSLLRLAGQQSFWVIIWAFWRRMRRY